MECEQKQDSTEWDSILRWREWSDVSYLKKKTENNSLFFNQSAGCYVGHIHGIARTWIENHGHIAKKR